MLIAPFSGHIFWSYKRDADLPENIIIQQVIAYGELKDFLLLSRMFSADQINEAIKLWKNKSKHIREINLLKKVYLDE